MSDWFEKNVPEEIAKVVINISVNLPDRQKFSRDFRPDVEIAWDELENQLEETPSQYAFWSSILAEHRALVAAIERKIILRRATLARKITEDAKAQSIKVAQWQVESLTEEDEELCKLEMHLIGANRTQSKLFAVMEAIKMKCDNLRSLAGFKREEKRNP